MATLITKNSSTASSVPTAAQLVQGELAVNVTDKRLFTENSSGTVVELGTNPSTLALPNGTANGVAYLNGSKVLTTGSALTFDGVTLKAAQGSSGTTAASNGNTLVLENSAAVGMSLLSPDANASRIYFGTASNNRNAFIYSDYNAGAQTLIFGLGSGTTAATEQARLTSTGLGIGTSSPGYPLQVRRAGGAGSLGITVDSVGSINRVTQYYSIGDTTAVTTGHAWYTRNASATDNLSLLLDNSGNLGLGVTPSAWGTTKALEFSYGSFSANSSLGTDVAGNCYYNGTNWIYRVTGVALRYNQATAGHSWHVASGTAGNTISFTQAMTLTAGGNLALGATSANARLDVVGGSIRVNEDSIGTKIITVRSDYAGVGPAINVTTSHPLLFLTDNTERARITSGGDLLVGTTSSTSNVRLRVDGGAIHGNAPTSISTGTYQLADNGSSPNTLRVYNNTDSNNTTNRFLICDAGASVLRAEIRSNGGIANYSANDVNLSDRREKTNLAPAKSYLDTICAIPVQTFNYIDQSEDDPGLTLGVVAQDVQAVAPELVMESNWGTEDNPKMRLSIYQTDLQYALMKALQELKAEFDAYKATHP